MIIESCERKKLKVHTFNALIILRLLFEIVISQLLIDFLLPKIEEKFLEFVAAFLFQNLTTATTTRGKVFKSISKKAEQKLLQGNGSLIEPAKKNCNYNATR